ncbi:MAG TPA: hypothetical protein VK891_10025, partial [Euzebyales bacterium]|nr:hypothetical protein [Euzebyales bacterium]
MRTSDIAERTADRTGSSSRWRVTATTFAAVAFGSTGVFAAITVAPLVAVSITGSAALGGVPTAAIGVGSVIGATAVSRTTAARGRRAGLLL